MQIEEKLVAVETKLRRWHTRLVRATNEVTWRRKKVPPSIGLDRWVRRLLRAAKEVTTVEKQRRRYHALLTGSPKRK